MDILGSDPKANCQSLLGIDTIVGLIAIYYLYTSTTTITNKTTLLFSFTFFNSSNDQQRASRYNSHETFDKLCQSIIKGPNSFLPWIEIILYSF